MLQTICNYIVLIAATIGAIVTICNAAGKPIIFFKKRKEKEKKLEEEHFVEEVTEHVSKKLEPKFHEIYEQNEKQSQEIEILNISSRDILRNNILKLYEEGKSTHQITETKREMLDDFFHDYKLENGNHYIDKIYGRMKNWEVIPDEQELDK